jgi:hypothetical protein
MCWITWPLFLCSILAFAKHKNQPTKFWQLKFFTDYLLLGAYLPLTVGIVVFNFKVSSNMQNETVTFSENLFYVGVYSVILWGITLASVFAFYLASKFFLKSAT